MKRKSMVTLVLVLFVLVSLVYVVVEEMGSRNEMAAIDTQKQSKTDTEETASSSTAEIASSNKEVKIVLYYFHATARCSNCKKFEVYSIEAIRHRFADALDNGRLEWQAINVDEPVNKHFIEEYRLITRSLILVEMQDGEQVGWKNLQKIWELVGDKEEFVKYVQSEVADFLGEGA
jgi:hypothetical protein